MILLWLILNALDALLTVFVVRAGGIEVMPVMGWLISQSLILFLIVKTAGTLAVVPILQRYPGALRVLNGAFLAIVATNGVSLLCLTG
jgi:hypothetical protein